MSTLTSELYRLYAPRLSEINFRLDLDVADPTVKPAHPAAVKKLVSSYLDLILKKHRKNSFHAPGRILLSSTKSGRFVLLDDTTLLTPEEKAPLAALATTTHATFTLRSRLGFGTRLTVA